MGSLKSLRLRNRPPYGNIVTSAFSAPSAVQLGRTSPAGFGLIALIEVPYCGSLSKRSDSKRRSFAAKNPLQIALIGLIDSDRTRPNSATAFGDAPDRPNTNTAATGYCRPSASSESALSVTSAVQLRLIYFDRFDSVGPTLSVQPRSGASARLCLAIQYRQSAGLPHDFITIALIGLIEAPPSMQSAPPRGFDRGAFSRIHSDRLPASRSFAVHTRHQKHTGRVSAISPTHLVTVSGLGGLVGFTRTQPDPPRAPNAPMLRPTTINPGTRSSLLS
jgi:hypothetical protein